MCQQGVNQLLSDWQGKQAREVMRGVFAKWKGVEASETPCPACEKILPVLRQELAGSSYYLPSRGIVRSLEKGQPCIALGLVKPGTRVPAPPAKVRSAWQGLMLDRFNVAFVDVVNGAVGSFDPAENWGFGDAPAELDSIARRCAGLAEQARREGHIPVTKPSGSGDSTATGMKLIDILGPAFGDHGYRFAASEVPTLGFWYKPRADLMFENDKGSRIAVEVKVSEDPKYPPTGQPACCLLHANGMIGIRVAHRMKPVDPVLAGYCRTSIARLEESGRARFLVV